MKKRNVTVKFVKLITSLKWFDKIEFICELYQKIKYIDNSRNEIGDDAHEKKNHDR